MILLQIYLGGLTGCVLWIWRSRQCDLFDVLDALLWPFAFPIMILDLCRRAYRLIRKRT